MTTNAPATRVGRRVVVSGLAGAGKSTFSRALAAKTGLPLVVLDRHFWRPGWVEPSAEAWREKQRALLAGDEWIADGNYHETLELRVERADTVVYLDTPWWVCSARAFVRGIRRPAGTEMPDGCVDSAWRRMKDEWWLVFRIWRVRNSEPALELRVLETHADRVTLHVLRTKRAVREFLAAVADDAPGGSGSA
ncbi:MAG TPA: hypothetical protein VHC63_02310 [Acidimicrobiales bacterium]|nr:hypothetical protein [Acidimicrobiales bacterium]